MQRDRTGRRGEGPLAKPGQAGCKGQGADTRGNRDRSPQRASSSVPPPPQPPNRPPRGATGAERATPPAGPPGGRGKGSPPGPCARQGAERTPAKVTLQRGPAAPGQRGRGAANSICDAGHGKGGGVQPREGARGMGRGSPPGRGEGVFFPASLPL